MVAGSAAARGSWFRWVPAAFFALSCASCITVPPGDDPPGDSCASPEDCGDRACLAGRCVTDGCGDLEVVAPELCDEGGKNGTTGTACTMACTLRGCGDGVVDTDIGELCEGDGCRLDCTDFSCGDGQLAEGESCDDGNTLGGDGCEPDCSCSGAKAIGLAWQTMLALRSDGTVFAWGENKGLLDGSETGVLLPLELQGLAAVEELAAGQFLLAVLSEEGEVRLFDGDPTRGGVDLDPAVPSPTVLTGLYRHVAAGTTHLVLLATDGTVEALGDNAEGEVGRDETGLFATPVAVRGLEGKAARSIAAGRGLSFAVLESGEVWAFGWSSYGQAGVQQGRVSTALKVPGLAGCDLVRTSGFTSFARCGGAWWGWGWDGYGQVETATQVAPEVCAGEPCRPLPALVRLEFTPVDFAVGRNSVYALDEDGNLWGWGEAAVAGGALNALGTGAGAQEVERSPQRLPAQGSLRAVVAGFRVAAVLGENGAISVTGDQVALGRRGEPTHAVDWLPALALCSQR